MTPVFLSPEYIYLEVQSIVKYNINKTILNPEDIRTAVISAILNYSTTNLNTFNKTFRNSRLLNLIDNSDASVISNDTEIRMIKYLTPVTGSAQNFIVNFNTPLVQDIGPFGDTYNQIDIQAVSSSTFIFAGQKNCKLADDGAGIVRIVVPDGSNFKKSAYGTISYLPAAFGGAVASVVIRDIIKWKIEGLHPSDKHAEFFNKNKKKSED
jgi:hypothetical protein